MFSKFIAQNRLKFELTQQQLADAAGISRWSLNMYERGERVPSMLTKAKISHAIHSLADTFCPHCGTRMKPRRVGCS